MQPNRNHPECADDEVWTSNTDKRGFSGITWKTKRMGTVAYSHTGEVIGEASGLFPVFVKRDEIRAQHPELLAELEAG